MRAGLHALPQLLSLDQRLQAAPFAVGPRADGLAPAGGGETRRGGLEHFHDRQLRVDLPQQGHVAVGVLVGVNSKAQMILRRIRRESKGSVCQAFVNLI